MRRREFITLLGGAAAWPIAARAQQADRMRRIGTLSAFGADDPEWQVRIAAFQHRLRQLGWIEGRNLRMDYRYSAGDPERGQTYAAELVALAPDVLLAGGGTSVPPLLRATRTVPVVFANVPDPVGSGIVDSLARPGGNITGFMLLKEVARGLKRVAVLRDATITPGDRSVCRHPVGRAIARGGGEPNRRSRRARDRARRHGVRTLRQWRPDRIGKRAGGGPPRAAWHKLPAIYYTSVFVPADGLMSYGPNITDQFRDAADYVDRILRGEKPGDLPVQAPTKYQLVINLKTAKALGIAMPPTLLARADEVIE